jgi:hypothetical protein
VFRRGKSNPNSPGRVIVNKTNPSLLEGWLSMTSFRRIYASRRNARKSIDDDNRSSMQGQIKANRSTVSCACGSRLGPPCCLIATAVNLSMMAPTQGDRELVADFAAKRP